VLLKIKVRSLCCIYLIKNTVKTVILRNIVTVLIYLTFVFIPMIAKLDFPFFSPFFSVTQSI